MTVPVRLAETGPYSFLVDTGADRTVVSLQLASSLSLPVGDLVPIHGIAGEVKVQTATVRNLQIGRSSYAAIDAPMLDSKDRGADGILGTDTLEARRIIFDFPSGTMSIVASGISDLRDEPGSIVIEGRRRNGRLVIADASTGGRHVMVVLDTGAQVCVGNEALRRELGTRSLLGGPLAAELQSVTGGVIRGDLYFLKEIQIEGVELRNLAIVFAPAHTFKELKLDDRPALLLGMNAFRAFKKVSIDFGTSKFEVIAQ
jgi:predicted aspartyl protease